jgi:hypothetical protein
MGRRAPPSPSAAAIVAVYSMHDQGTCKCPGPLFDGIAFDLSDHRLCFAARDGAVSQGHIVATSTITPPLRSATPGVFRRFVRLRHDVPHIEGREQD